MKTQYVVGFMFSTSYNMVLLVRKQRPDWQRGLLNGIGGHIEDGEDANNAMERECREETGINPLGSWNQFCEMSGINNDGEGFQITCFWSVGHIDQAVTTDEPLEVVHLVDTHCLRRDTIGNLPWLIAMARDFAAGVHPPTSVEVKYGKTK